MSQSLAFKPFILDREEPDSTIDSVASILAYMSVMAENVGNGVLKGGTDHLSAEAWTGQALLLDMLRETLAEASKDVDRMRRCYE